jgi:HD-like signal output (HDOD) protein
MAGLLRRLTAWLGGGPAAEAARRPAPPSARAPSPADAPPPPAPAPPGAPAEATATPFAPFAKALGVPEPAAPPAGDEGEAAEDPQELELSERILEHFRANRLGPASAPSLSLRILSLVAAPEPDVGELSRLVSADPALTAGVLQVANSAAYRGLMEVETVRDAIVRLGFDEVARVAGALSARSLFNPRMRAEIARYRASFAALYHRALTVANAAAWEAMQVRGGRADRAFLGGMLHDVGKSVALRSVAALSLEKRLQVPTGGPALDRLLDRVHLEVGAESHQEWGLPQYLTVIAVRHHDREIPSDAEFADLHAVRLAGAIADLRGEPAVAHRAAAELVQSAGALGRSPLQVRSLAAELRDGEQRVTASFGLDG